VLNPEGKTVGVDKFIVDGKEIEEKEIKLQDDGGVYNIEVIM